MERPNVKEQDFVGKEAHLRHREEEPAAILCTLTIDDHTSAAGVKRYPLGREPITLRDGTPLTDAKGRRSYVTSAGAGPSLGKYLLMAYLPPEQAVEGSDALAVEYMNERFPVTVAVVGATRALRSRECEDPLVKVLVCVKRVPMTGGRIVLTDDELAIETQAPRLRDQPARGVRRRGGRAARRAARRRVGRAHARPGRRGGAAARRDGDRHRSRDPPRDGRRGVGSRGDRRRDRRGDPCRRGRVGAVRPRSSSATSRPTPAASRSGSVSRYALGRPCATGLKSVVVEGGERALRAGGRRRSRRLRAAAARRR